MKNFNVATDKWIPVVLANGSQEQVSPKEIFERDDCISFGGDPVENFCILKFLTVLAQSTPANQPKIFSQWKNLKDTFSENVVNYISENEALFNFFGINPFLQWSFIDKTEWEPLRLREKICSGNNAVLYSEQLETEINIEKIVLDLIVHQNFSVSFGRSFQSPKNCMYKNSPNGNLNFYAELDTCKNTIWFNMSYSTTENFGKPIWESGQSQDYTECYLNYMFPATTKIQISEDLKFMKYAKGFDYSDLFNENPFVVHVQEKYKNEITTRPMSVNENFIFWKEYASVLVSTKENLPQIFQNKKLNLVENISLKYLGIKFSSSSGYSYTDQLYEGSYVVSNPGKFEEEQFKNFYKDLVTKTNDVVDVIKSNIRNRVLKMRQDENKFYMKGADKDIYELFVNQHVKNLYKKIDNFSYKIFLYEGSTEDMNSWKEILSTCVEEILYKFQEDVLMYHYLTTSIEYFKLKNIFKKEETNE